MASASYYAGFILGFIVILLTGLQLSAANGYEGKGTTRKEKNAYNVDHVNGRKMLLKYSSNNQDVKKLIEQGKRRTALQKSEEKSRTSIPMPPNSIDHNKAPSSSSSFTEKEGDSQGDEVVNMLRKDYKGPNRPRRNPEAPNQQS